MQKIASSEQTLINKQMNEMGALRKKIEAGVKEQEKQRAKELERLLQRYQNVKKELDNQHRIQKNKLEQANTVKSKSVTDDLEKNTSQYFGKSGTMKYNQSVSSSRIGR